MQCSLGMNWHGDTHSGLDCGSSILVHSRLNRHLVGTHHFFAGPLCIPVDLFITVPLTVYPLWINTLHFGFVEIEVLPIYRTASREKRYPTPLQIVVPATIH